MALNVLLEQLALFCPSLHIQTQVTGQCQIHANQDLDREPLYLEERQLLGRKSRSQKSTRS